MALAAALLVLPLAAACTVDAPSSGGSPNAGDEPFTGPMRIAVITHGDDGGFWSTVRKGAEDAAATLPDVTLDYQGSAGDARVQSDMINAALNQGANALAVSAPDPGAISSALDRAEAAGVPIITLNSGSELLDEREGVITHVGQTERDAGVGAGKALKDLGATRALCIIHEENNVGLQERCNGAAEGLGGDDTIVRVQVTGNTDLTSTAREVGAAMEAHNPDAVLTLDPDIAMAALREVSSRGATLATFDLSPGVLDAVQAGQIAFAVDQQPYLQGYLPVTFLELAVRNRNEVGAGQIVATGPSLVTKENAAAIAALSEQGSR
jgi:simple sugar transport system substrate-binding protein